jgi:hypothetical protein
VKALTLLILAASFGAAGCESSDDAAERFRARQRAADPLQLWSIEVTAPTKSGPITICTDRFLREGFTRPLPNEDGKQCALHEPPTLTNGNWIVMRCTLNDHDFLVRSIVTGDLESDFEVDYVIKGPNPDVRQVRRHRLIGPCPQGWEIGDNTDQQGRLRKNALN